MKLSITSLVGFAALFAQTLAVNVACLVNGVQVAIVDLDTGICPFTIPDYLPCFFEFISPEDYNIEFYYAIAQNLRYTNDIVHAGRVINIPARLLYGTPGSDLFQVHLEKHPASNSTAAIRKRLFKDTPLVKRDAADDFAETIKDTDGTDINVLLQVVDLAESSTGAGESSTGTGGSSSGAGTATVTESSTTVITVTSCSAGTCTTNTVPATPTTVTTTTNGVTTIYTTLCPLSTETVTESSTTIVTITACSNNICVPTTVPAVPSVVTTTVNEVVTVYTTYCPLTSVETLESTKTITITSCSENKCSATEVPATPKETTVTVEGTVTQYITYCPITSGEVPPKTGTGKAPIGESTTTVTTVIDTSTVTSVGPHTGAPGASTGGAPGVSTGGAPGTKTGAGPAPTSSISIFEGGAAAMGSTILALALVPLAYFI